MTQIRITSLNVRGINNDVKRKDVLEYLTRLGSNIYCLQDIHCSEKQQVDFKKDWDGEMIISCGTNYARGVAILFKRNFEFQILEIKQHILGNYVALKIKMIDTEVTLISLYGPNVDDPNFYNNITEIIDEFQTPTIIICGDWNLVQNQTLDTKFYLRNNNIKAREKVNTIKEQYDLCDPWRICNPQKRQYTWFQSNPKKMSRLDFYLVSGDIMTLTSKTDIKPGYRSDHSIINLTLTICNDVRGKGFWKLNTSLLRDPDYIRLIKQTIKDNIERYAIPDQDITDPDVMFTITDQLFFETLKMEIRQSTIPFASRKKKEKERKENNLVKEIEEIETNINDTDNPNITERLAQLKSELEKIRLQEIKVSF